MRAHMLNEVFNFRLSKTLLAAFLVVVSDGIVENFALIFVQLYTCTHTLSAPTVLAVVAEQTRIEFVVGSAANGACSECGKHLKFADVAGLRDGCVAG